MSTAPPSPAPPAGAAQAPPAVSTQSPSRDICPLCGGPLHSEQEWCLRCGAAARTRLAAAPNWRGPAIAVALIVAISLGVLAASLVKLAGDSGSGSSTTVAVGALAPGTTAAGVITTSTAAGSTAASTVGRVFTAPSTAASTVPATPVITAPATTTAPHTLKQATERVRALKARIEQVLRERQTTSGK